MSRALLRAAVPVVLIDAAILVASAFSFDACLAGLIFLILCFLAGVPAALIAMVRRRARDRRAGRFNARHALAFLLSLPVASLALHLNANHLARREAAFAPVIDALDRQRAAEGRYPTALTGVAPRYLDALPPGLVSGSDRYALDERGEDFLLTFRGMATQTHVYSSREKRWTAPRHGPERLPGR